MINLTTAALFFLAAGILTSVSILSAYHVIFAIPLIYYSYLAIKQKKVDLPKSAWFLLIFILIAALSLIVNYQVVPNPSKNFGRLRYYIYGLGGIFVFRVWVKEASDKAKAFLTYTFLLSITVAAGAAIFEYLTGTDDRAKGLTDTMRYGYGSSMLLLTLLSALLHQEKIKNWFNWKVALPVFILGFLGMYLTYTRGALLGFICGLPFVLYFYKPKVGLWVGSVAFVLVTILAGVYFFGTGKYNSRFLYNQDNSGDVMRRSQWQAAVIAIKEKPVLGWGLSNFHTQVERIKNENDLGAKFYKDAHAHNLFLEVATGTGLVGAFLFLSWIIFWALESFKKGGLVCALVVPFGVAFVISSQFEVTFDSNNASMIFFLYGISNVE